MTHRQELSDIAELADLVNEQAAHRDRYVVAISGFGGSGKTTLSEKLRELLGAAVIHVDDFIAADERGAKDGYPHDWDKFEELTARHAKTGSKIVSRIYDWPSNGRVFEQLDVGKYLIVEGTSGLIRDSFRNYFDLTVWIDVPADIAHSRGKTRDKIEQHADHDDLWDNVWAPLELDAFEELRPDLKADVLLRNDGSSSPETSSKFAL